MIDEFLNEIKELQEYKKKYLCAEKDKQRMSDLLYEYATKEYERMPKQKRIDKYKEECCKCCRHNTFCEFDLPDDIYKPVKRDNAWIPGTVTCGNFEWSWIHYFIWRLGE